MKPVQSKWITAEVAEVFRCIYTLFNASHRDMECFNQLQMQIFFYILNKTLNTDIDNYLKNENRL